MYKALSPGALGFSTPFAEAAPVAAAHGFEGYWFNAPADLAQGAETVSAMLAQHRLRPAGFGLPVNFRTDEETFRNDLDRLTELVESAATVGLKRTATWIMPCHDTLNFDENFQLHTERLSEVAAVLDDFGISLGLEFVGPRTLRESKKFEFIHNFDQLLSLYDAIGRDNVGILLDIFHWETASQNNGDFARMPSEKFVVLVHVNDAVAGRSMDEQVDNERRLPGETGVLPIGKFMENLRELHYSGPVVVEPFSAALRQMPFEAAVSATADALATIWT